MYIWSHTKRNMDYHYKTALSSAIQIHIKVHNLFYSKLIVAIMYKNTSLLLFFIIHSIKQIQLNILYIYSTSFRQISNSLKSLKMSLHCPMETVLPQFQPFIFILNKKWNYYHSFTMCHYLTWVISSKHSWTYEICILSELQLKTKEQCLVNLLCLTV